MILFKKYLGINHWIILALNINKYQATASAQRTFSDPKPPINLFANAMVLLVASASCWQWSFSAVAFSKSAVNLESSSSKDWIDTCFFYSIFIG